MRGAARQGVQVCAAMRSHYATAADRAAALMSARVIALSNIPRSVIPSDIHRLAPNASSIDFLRSPQLQLNGSALVALDSDMEATEFACLDGQMALGGAVIRARQISVAEGLAMIRAPYAARPATTAALDTIAASSMRAVLLRGIPPKTTPEKLEKKLRRSYSLAEYDIEVPLFCGVTRHDRPHTRVPAVFRVPPATPWSTVATFLVRLHTTEEAMRLARAWHRTHYAPQKYGVERTGDRYVVDASVLY